MYRLNASSVSVFNSAAVPVQPIALVHLPETTDGDLERYEGMLVGIQGTLTVSQNHFLGRYGQVTLSAEGRMYAPLNGNGLGDTTDYNRRRMLVLDDGSAGQNPNPIPFIGADNTLRAGDTVYGLYGIIESGLIDSSGTIDYRLQPPLVSPGSTPAGRRARRRHGQVAAERPQLFHHARHGRTVTGGAHQPPGANTPPSGVTPSSGRTDALDADVVGDGDREHGRRRDSRFGRRAERALRRRHV
jgi:hypothetical protein